MQFEYFLTINHIMNKSSEQIISIYQSLNFIKEQHSLHKSKEYPTCFFFIGCGAGHVDPVAIMF